MPERFTSWRRPAVFAEATDQIVGDRLLTNLPLVLSDGPGAERRVDVPFLLTGPQDVTALAAGAVVARQPAPGTQNAEITRVAHVELGDADLPWRYTPRRLNDPRGTPPWLVLVVGETGTEVTFSANGTVTVTKPALALHDLTRSTAWAHVHDLPGRSVSRILSPRALEAGRAWTAVLVPAFRVVTGNDLIPNWNAGTPFTTLPCYDSWQFSTVAEQDDFRAIAGRLEPVSPTERQQLDGRGFGRASISVQTGTGPATLATAGALTVPGSPATPPAPQQVRDRVQQLAGTGAHAGRWVLRLPRYDDPWSPPDPPPAPPGWRNQLHEDPRHRGAAGLGAWAAVAWQDRIARGATTQAGALAQVAERIRSLTLGLEAARSQWRSHLPAPGVGTLAVLAPMLARIPTPSTTGRTTSVLDDLADRTPWLVPALFSSAARRMLRPRSSLQRAAGAQPTSIAALIGTAARRCPGQQPPLPGQEDLPGLLADPDTVAGAGDRFARAGWEMVNEIGEQLGADDPGFDPGQLFEVPDPEGVGTVVGWWPEHDRPCHPLADPHQVGVSVAGAVDPTVARPVVVDHVVGGVSGLRPPELAPPDLALELDIPLWSFLRDATPDWLLPGAKDLGLDRLMALQTNPEFVDAFLVGANHRALGELRWRNIPVVSGWTPLRRFWQRITDDGTAGATDVRPVLDIRTTPASRTWTPESVLGAEAHQTGAPASLFVVLFHSELFRRYPATQVYLAPDPATPAAWETLPNVDGPPAPTRVHPNLTGSLDPELVFFGFPLTPAAARSYWLVLEEPPPGFRFQVPDGADAQIKDGAQYAATTLDRPVRAFFGRLLQ